MAHGLGVGKMYFFIAAFFALIVGVGTIFYAYGIVIPEIEGHRTHIVDISSSDRREQLSEIYNWEIYRNNKYRFEFRYPASWGIVEQNGLIGIGKKTDILRHAPGLWVKVQPNVLRDRVEDLQRYERINFTRQCETIEFAGETGFECDSLINTTSGRIILFYKDDKIIEIMDSIQSETSELIVSTLEFS